MIGKWIRMAATVLVSWIAIAVLASAQEGARIQGDPKALRVEDNLAYARGMAQQWQADAILVGILADQVKPDGTVDVSLQDGEDSEGGGLARIAYRFHSPSQPAGAEAYRMVLLRRGTIALAGDDENRATKALPEKFLDFEAACRKAQEKGATSNGTLSLQHDASIPAHPFCWVFVSPETTLLVDAVSGDEVERPAEPPGDKPVEPEPEQPGPEPR